MDAFVKTHQNPSSRIDQTITTDATKQVEKNRSFLHSIIRCIEFCGRQGISLRGHRDGAKSDFGNQGNLRALPDLCIASGDKELQEHLEKGAKNAQYISKTAQNDFLTCIKGEMQEEIVKEIQMQS